MNSHSVDLLCKKCCKPVDITEGHIPVCKVHGKYVDVLKCYLPDKEDTK